MAEGEEDIVSKKYGVDESKFEGEFIKLESNKPTELEFTPNSVKQRKKEVRDDKTNEVSQRWFVELGVDAVNGKRVPEDEEKVLSFSSKRLWKAMRPLLDKDGTIYNKTIRIEKTGEKFETQYSVIPKGDRKFEPIQGEPIVEKQKVEVK